MREDLISSIYGGPLESPPWAAALPRLRRLTNSTRMMLKFTPVGAGDRGAIYTDSGVSAREWEPGGSAEIYSRIYQHKDPVQYGTMARGDVRQFEDLIDRRDLIASEFYRQLCAPLDIYHAFFFYLGRWSGVDAWLNGSRGKTQGAFSANEIASARSLFPHLSRAVHIHCQMGQYRSSAAIYGQSVSALGVGVIMVSRRGRIVATNAEAEAILDEGSPMFRSGEELRLVGDAQLSYAAIVGQITSGRGPAVRTFTASDGEASVTVLVRPAAELDVAGASSATAYVVYLSREAPALTDRAVDFVAKAFGLTRAEARLSVLLASGLALDDIASRLGVTLTTARTYCKSALAKTGAPRQAELVRLVIQGLARLA